MPNRKISDFTPIPTPLSGFEIVPLVIGGDTDNYRGTVNDLLAGVVSMVEITNVTINDIVLIIQGGNPKKSKVLNLPYARRLVTFVNTVINNAGGVEIEYNYPMPANTIKQVGDNINMLYSFDVVSVAGGNIVFNITFDGQSFGSFNLPNTGKGTVRTNIFYHSGIITAANIRVVTEFLQTGQSPIVLVEANVGTIDFTSPVTIDLRSTNPGGGTEIRYFNMYADLFPNT